VCRKSYINPALFIAWQDGQLRRRATRGRPAVRPGRCSPFSRKGSPAKKVDEHSNLFTVQPLVAAAIVLAQLANFFCNRFDRWRVYISVPIDTLRTRLSRRQAMGLARVIG
jgi:hypothetical protein